MSTVALYEGKAALYKAHPSCTTGHLTRFRSAARFSIYLSIFVAHLKV